ncbi:DNA-binding CsgD family transcriptional regulator [Hamadaea flava]|uniref:LuxR C-terminal-related transcriptional regulator n=1 Tax=Hamadaea flava TaxID=1742688 RepID=A0ABV8LRZ9_9ACTN|nr:helix-turn-helix transcriptional regulator [Hamadaea flava]MCP2322257.1 DNA-binding CsgD family transcriptional regulator [Hamadaea flava]
MTTEPPDLTARSWALRAEVARRVADAMYAGAPQGRMRLFAEGLSEINSRLPALERITESSIFNLQPRTFFDPLRREREPNQRTRLRGIRGHMITAPAVHLSLLAACHPDTWVAPVHIAGLVIDERLALFPGPLSVRGKPTAWLCDDPDLIEAFCDLWVRVQDVAVPIRDIPGVVELTERQLNVVSLLSAGAKDATVARLLGVSARTVTSDVSRIFEALHVSTRWEAGMVLGQATMPVPPARVDRLLRDRRSHVAGP